MKLQHIISSKQFDKNFLSLIFKTADQIKAGKYKNHVLDGKIMATIFYEPSTRTRLSFESSMSRLGGKVIGTESAGEFSSAAKGETLEDTIRIVHSYSDVIVLRHYNPGASEIASKYSKVPVINAGDGNGEHPTQALLDLYTIFSKVKNKDIKIAMVGDLLNGRTIHSLCYLLSLYPSTKITFVSPQGLKVPQYTKDHLKNSKVEFVETEDFEKGISNADIVYQTRIQKERFKTQAQYKKYFGKYIINSKIMESLGKNTLIMHPLPRINEITSDIDSDPRVIFFEQAANGVYIRMALLLYLFDKISS